MGPFRLSGAAKGLVFTLWCFVCAVSEKVPVTLVGPERWSFVLDVEVTKASAGGWRSYVEALYVLAGSRPCQVGGA